MALGSRCTKKRWEGLGLESRWCLFGRRGGRGCSARKLVACLLGLGGRLTVILGYVCGFGQIDGQRQNRRQKTE